MKRCPFCAEEIQDAAIVCKHCGRDLTATTPTPSSSNPAGQSRPRPRWMWWVGGLGFLFIIVMALGQPSDSPESSGDALRVSAGKGVGGLAITNTGDQGIHECEVSAESDGIEWAAEPDEFLQPNETTRVGWEQFKSKAQPMPTYIGFNQRQFRVECTRAADGTRRYAVVRFDK